MNPDSGEAWQVTDDQFGVSSYEWSNNGKHPLKHDKNILIANWAGVNSG